MAVSQRKGTCHRCELEGHALGLETSPELRSSHLLRSHHADRLALEEVSDEFGNEGAVNKKEGADQTYFLFSKELQKLLN